MIKFIFAAGRNPKMSQDEYRHYVSQVHGPLVVATAEVSAPMLRYVQHFALPDRTDTAFRVPIAADRHNVVTMVMTSFEAMMKSLDSRQYREIIKPDEARFEDPDSPVLAHFADELEVVPGVGGRIKLFHFLKRRADISRDSFQHQWAERQAKLLAGNRFPRLTAYVQNHIQPQGSLPFGVADEGIDFIDEYSFEDLAAMENFGEERSNDAALSLAELTDSARSFAVITEPVTMLDRLSHA